MTRDIISKDSKLKTLSANCLSLFKVFEKAKAIKIHKFLQNYVLLHDVPQRTVGLVQARCRSGQSVKTIFKSNNIELIAALIHDLRAVGLIETR